MYNRYPLKTKVNTVAVVKSGIPVSVLAKKLGVPRGTIYDWIKCFKNKVEPASPEVLLDLGFEANDNCVTDLVVLNNLKPEKIEEQPLVEVKTNHGTNPSSAVKITCDKFSLELATPCSPAELVAIINAIGGCNVL